MARIILRSTLTQTGVFEMSKKQVLLLSFLVAVPALGLLTVLVLGGTVNGNGGNMFSGIMTVFVAMTGILALCLGLSPFAVMAFYPADGFGMMGPPPEAGDSPLAPPTRTGEDEDDEFDDADDFEPAADGFDDDEFESDGFDDEGDFEGEEMYDDYDGEEYDEEEWK